MPMLKGYKYKYCKQGHLMSENAKSSGRKRRCKICNTKSSKASALRLNYNMTIADLEAMKVAQDNKCAICKEVFILSKNCHIDHDHNYGTIRGLLCSHCNQGLGHFKDNPLTLKIAINYLLDNMKELTECHLDR